MTKFSVLMSLYEKETPSNLEDCLCSLNNQLVKSSEVVLVYDGYVSNLLKEVVNKYQEPLNITVVNIEKNVGLGNALNIGMNHCSFELIARMDTDDICLPDRFSKQIEYFSNNPQVRLLGTGITEFDEYGNKRSKILPVLHDEIESYIKKKNPFNHMTVFFYKEDVLKVGGYRHHLYMEDYNLWLRMINFGIESANIKEICVDVRVGKDMILRRRGLII